MRTTLSAVQTKQLNNASSPSPSGVVEQITGLRIPTGTNSGDFVELTDAQALALSDTPVGTLYGGVYQRVKINSSVTGLAIGQALFWDRSDTTDPYAVTNATAQSPNAYDYAGTYIDKSTTAGNYVWMQVNGRINALMTGAGAIGDVVLFPLSSTNEYAPVSTTPTSAPTISSVVGSQVAAAGGLASWLSLT